MSQLAQKKSHVVSKIEPSGISLFRISVDTIFLKYTHQVKKPTLPDKKRFIEN